MARLIYSMITSFDGYIADAEGDFSWGDPGEQVHAFVNDLERDIGTYLYGRQMYEMMVYWEAAPAGQSAVEQEFTEIWQAANKIVFSTTLEKPVSARTRIERSFDPGQLQDLKDKSPRDISIGGPEIASHALRAGLVDECRFFLCPIIIGGGKRTLPEGLRLDLELQEERRFDNGMVYVRYDVAT